MENAAKRLQQLFEKYLRSEIAEEEYHELWLLLEEKSVQEVLKGNVQSLWEIADRDKSVIPAAEWDERMHQLLAEAEGVLSKEVAARNKLLRRTAARWAVAATVLLVVLTGALYFHSSRKQASVSLARKANSSPRDPLPGGNRATLTLANGSVITLDSTTNGLITRQGNAKVLKLRGGQLAYNSTGRNPKEVVYNTLNVPRGGQYELILPDGSRVWLNSASSIRFPTAFRNKERAVEITGEAYFEIAKNAAMPFSISVDGMTVKVLGTHFNVMAYDDEQLIKTTLLEGAVKVSKGSKSTLLRPGEQAVINKSSDKINVAPANTAETVAWKNGLFQFDGEDMATIMRKIARWYDVNVTYEHGVPPGHYTGVISRNTRLSEVLKMLELNGIQFKIEERNLTVL